MTQTRVDIVARDQTARAFASVDGRLRGLSSGVSRLTGLFGGLTAGLAAFGAARSIRGIIDAQDALAKTSQSTGIAVESLAGLEFAASQSGTSLERISKAVGNFSRIVLEAEGGTDKYSRLIKGLGLNLEELKNATPEQQFIALAGAINANVSEQERAAVITSLLGQRYTELIPLLNQGADGIQALIDKGRELNPVTEKQAQQAELFNDNLDKLGRKAKNVGINITNDLLPALTRVTDEMERAGQESGFFGTALAGVAQGYKELIFSLTGLVTDEQFVRGLRLEQHLEKIRTELKGAGDEAENTAEALEETVKPQLFTKIDDFSDLFRKLAQESKNTSTSTTRVNKGLSDQERQAQATARRIQQLNRQYDPLIRRNEELAEVTKLANQGLSQTAVENAQIEIINRYINATTEAAESVQEIDDKTVKLGETTRQVFDSNEQIIISSVRRMQGAIADGLFNFFDDGLKGMFNSVKSTLGRIVSEFASIKLLQATGLGSVLGGIATGASAGTGISNGLSLASLGTSALSLVNSGFGATSLIGSAAVNAGQFLNSSALVDFGVGALSPNLLSGGGGFAASAGSTFSSLAGPLAVAGIADFGLRQLFGDKKLGGTAGDILSFVPVVGTLINGLFGRGAPKFRREELIGSVGAGGFEGVFNTQFREKGGLLRGNRVSNFITDTDTGELLNQFGRLSESGNFPKGLLDSVGGPASERALEIGKFLDETFTTLADTLENTAEVLGISKDSLANFNAELDLTSEKGEQLSQEQISEAIADISDQMVRELIPSIDELSRSSESATDTLRRLSADFQAVESGFILAGESVADARNKAQGLGFESRASITDRFGGAGGLQAQLDSFFNNVLNESQQLEIVETRINDVLQKAGIDFIPTLDQLVSAFQEGSPAVQELVLQYDDLIVQHNALKEAAEGLAGATEVLADAAEDAAHEERALAKERNAFTAGRREAQAGGLAPTIATTIGGRLFTADEIRAQQQASVEEGERRLRSITQEQIARTNQAVSLLSGQLRNIEEASNFFDQFKEDALELAGTNFTAAREQVNAATLLARAGASIELIDTPELAQAIEKLKEDRSAFFSTRKEFEQERARAVSEIEELSLSGKDNAQQQIDLLTDQLNTLDKMLAVQQQTLITIDDATGAPLDPSRLSDEELQAQSRQAGRGLFESLRVQAGTTFNGAVRFADAFGQNESADAQALARFGNLLTPQAATGGAQSEAINALKDQIKELKEQLTTTANAQTNLFNLLAPLARDGDTLRVTTV